MTPIEIKTLKSGQARPYADSVYHYHITFDKEVSREEVEQIAQTIKKSVISEEMVTPFDTELVHLKEIGNTKDNNVVWSYKVREAYTG